LMRYCAMHPIEEQIQQTRRQFMTTAAGGIGGLALTALLGRETSATIPGVNPLAPRPNHVTPKAKACIFIFTEGGPSQMDLFDPKPMLNKLNGQPLPDSLTKDMRFAFIQKETATVLGSNQEFKKYGECGMDFSTWLPHIGSCADDI